MQKVLKTARGEQADQFGGVPLPNGTTADFGRMDYKIATKPDAWYRYKSEKNSNDNDRSEEVVRALASYTGSDKAVTVLAAVLGQAPMLCLKDFLTAADGKGVI